ncbi:hypothetical protein ISN44_As09g007280, partial [Arabidopsis suecica]
GSEKATLLEKVHEQVDAYFDLQRPKLNLTCDVVNFIQFRKY